MHQNELIIVGLGSSGAENLTRQAWEHLSRVSEVWLRTALHPAVAGLPESLQVHSFDALYEQHTNLQDVLASIVTQVLTLAQRPQGVTYAVPGSPYVAESTVSELLRRAPQIGLSVRVIDGLSFIEPVSAALGLDPSQALVTLDALTLAGLHVPPFPPSLDALISELGSRQDLSELKLTLMANYPDEYPVVLVHHAGLPEQQLERLPLYAIDQSSHLGLLSTLYLPARENGRSFEDFQQIIARLRAPDGCPWDRSQTHLSLRPFLLEEAYEVLDALDKQDAEHLKEELGDLLLQILLHAQIASEDEDFNMSDVLFGISSKLVRRHPHVFGELEVKSVDNVLQNWEKIKAEERKDAGEGQKGMLEGIPLALPALTQADQIQRRAERVGFDWQSVEPVVDKVREELGELLEAQGPAEQQAEGGDLLFAVVNLLRWLKIDPETALRETNARFRRRFAYIEAGARAQGKAVEALSFAEMDALWEAAKRALPAHDQGEESAAQSA